MYMFFCFAENINMKKSTKILLILYVVILIPTIIFGKYLFSAIKPTGTSFTFDFNLNSILAIGFNIITMILGTILFFRLINSLAMDKAIFFSSLPLVIIYGIAIFFLAQLSTYENEAAKSASALLNITRENNYNTILWAILLTILFVSMLFLNFFVICKPVGRIEKIVSRLGDGKVKGNKLRVGGIKQFNTIEHGLNKINNHYHSIDSNTQEVKLEIEKNIPKQIYRILGKSAVQQLKAGQQVKRIVTTVLIKLIGKGGEFQNLFEDNFQVLSSYVNEISSLIRKEGGFVKKYVGEGILAVFPTSQSALDCIHVISRAIEIKNRQLKSLPNIILRASILNAEVDFVLTGNEDGQTSVMIKCDEQSINKLDEIAKITSSIVVFTKRTLDQLPLNYKFAYRYIGSLSLGEKQLLFEDLEVCSKDKAKLYLKTKSIFEKGVMFYTSGEYEKAMQYLEEAVKSNPNDDCAYLYFNRCKEKIG